MPSENGYANIKVNWWPNNSGRTGSHFFAKYRLKGETTWLSTEHILDSDFTTIRALKPDETYEFVVASVDGDYITESIVQDVPTSTVRKQTYKLYCHKEQILTKFHYLIEIITHFLADGPEIIPKENIANAGWLIGMLLAIAILLLLLIIVCIVKRNRGGKYDVHDRELANGRRDYPEEGGFHEYSQP